MAITSTNNLQKGSKGNDVLELQKLLNKNGYNLAEDGSFGAKTLAAVEDYQKRSGLKVDGIVGTNTWGALTSASNKSTSGNTSTGTNTSASTPQAAPDYSKYSYDASADTAYQQALAALQQATAAVPTYKASYDDQLQEIYDKIVNRDKFTYDLNSDALYQQYADQYQRMGQLAMMDTMGQAAALTGGYGNSYASTAGNQAYQAYLQQLNNVVPELYGMALDQYNAEGDKLLTQYSMLGDMADDEYGKYQDALAQYWQNVNYQKQNADAAYDRGYTDWLNSYQMGVDAENTAYSKQQAEYEKLVSLITSTGYAPTAAELEAAGMSKNQAAAYADYYKKQNTVITGSRSSGGGGGGNSGYDNGSLTQVGVSALQKALGVEVDGKWGPKSQAAALKKWGVSSADEAYKIYTGGKDLDLDGFKDTAKTSSNTTANLDSVSNNIKNKLSGFTNNIDMANYLDGLTSSGSITEKQADALYAEYKQPDQAALSKRSWTLVDNGGVNWFWGIDNNATVKDQYDNKYTLDKLVDALVSEGMSKSDAKAYVKKLQAQLGA
jgi:peptidoglycan hydrolase-like protein with peptidoglycan-binding domain